MKLDDVVALADVGIKESVVDSRQLCNSLTTTFHSESFELTCSWLVKAATLTSILGSIVRLAMF